MMKVLEALIDGGRIFDCNMDLSEYAHPADYIPPLYGEHVPEGPFTQLLYEHDGIHPLTRNGIVVTWGAVGNDGNGYTADDFPDVLYWASKWARRRA